MSSAVYVRSGEDSGKDRVGMICADEVVCC